LDASEGGGAVRLRAAGLGRRDRDDRLRAARMTARFKCRLCGHVLQDGEALAHQRCVVELQRRRAEQARVDLTALAEAADVVAQAKQRRDALAQERYPSSDDETERVAIERIIGTSAPAHAVPTLSDAIDVVNAALRRRAEILGQPTLTEADQAEREALNERLSRLMFGRSTQDQDAWEIVRQFAGSIEDGSMKAVPRKCYVVSVAEVHGAGEPVAVLRSPDVDVWV